jgi:phenylalanyl-tRNA synthetase beta chain
MTISYKWLSEYLPVTIEPEKLSKILTSVGLEVESLKKYEEIKGGLKGLVIGEVIEVTPHLNADKLKLTKVNIGKQQALSIVCGAPNVAVGQKVVVAILGATIYPIKGEPLTMKLAKIRGEESQGMICAEDEIGMGSSHAGIMVLPDTAKVGMEAANFFHPYEDWIYEIGLTPNRMDAMSHWGVARDVCAYISHHEKKAIKPKIPNTGDLKPGNTSLAIDVKIENAVSCPRYTGISIANITIKESPQWLQQKLKAIGLRPINNIVDITNYIQNETGQPLHAFDADKIAGKKIIVKNLPEGTNFVTLDEKERKLSAEDLMICDDKGGICIAGVFGGLYSGVGATTKNIFLESAYFDPVSIRKTSFRHGLRTDAASRFEKGTDISATVTVLKRAVSLIKEICGGEPASAIIDIYPEPKEKKQVALKYHYLKKLSGKNYHPDAVKNILVSLGFEIIKEGIDELWVAVPYRKPDISLPADVVEEILRIDGLDSIQIPESIMLAPAVEENYLTGAYREKISSFLVGAGFDEIMTNSITNSAYFSEEELSASVKLMNNLSEELNIMRPSMLETGLASIAHNLNRKNVDLLFFEFGKTYSSKQAGIYREKEHLCLYITGKTGEDGWRKKGAKADFYDLKGVAGKIIQLLGLNVEHTEQIAAGDRFENGFKAFVNGKMSFLLSIVNKKLLAEFGIKQPVFFADFDWEVLSAELRPRKVQFEEIPRFPSVERDLAILAPKQLPYEAVEKTVKKIRIDKLQEIKLFDIFESEKLGADKKSLAVNFTFYDHEKTLTDKEIDNWMNKIMAALEKDLEVQIRK